MSWRVFEGTLDEVIERLDNSELKASLDALQTTVTALRVSIEPPTRGPEGNEESEEPVTLETGITVQAPLFIKTGEKIKIDTRTGKYMERA